MLGPLIAGGLFAVGVPLPFLLGGALAILGAALAVLLLHLIQSTSQVHAHETGISSRVAE